MKKVNQNNKKVLTYDNPSAGLSVDHLSVKDVFSEESFSLVTVWITENRMSVNFTVGKFTLQCATVAIGDGSLTFLHSIQIFTPEESKSSVEESKSSVEES